MFLSSFYQIQPKGESGRNAYSRGLEHQRDLQDEKEDSPLWKHCTLQHNNEKVNFSMKTHLIQSRN